MKKDSISGFSLVEIMVVTTIFALLGVLVSQSLALSIRGSKKSEISSKIRSSLSIATGIMERQIRNANSITTCADNKVSYVDGSGVNAEFECTADNIASASAGLSTNLIDSASVLITPSCTITCSLDTEGVPDGVTLNITGRDPNVTGAESAEVSIQSRILLRNY